MLWWLLPDLLILQKIKQECEFATESKIFQANDTAGILQKSITKTNSSSIDELIDIKKLHSAKAIMNVKEDAFYVNCHFPDNPVMPGVFIVEAFGQAAAALTAHGIDKKEYENKLVFLMSVEKARFRNPVVPDCKLELNIEAIRSHGRVWKYKGEAFVEGKKWLMLSGQQQLLIGNN